MASETLTELPQSVATATAEKNHGTQTVFELDSPSCKCGSQVDRPADDVIWCIADIARHYRRSPRWAYRRTNQQGFPKPTRGDAHRWYKKAILEWDRNDHIDDPTGDPSVMERLHPKSAQLSLAGKTVRPSRRVAGVR